MIGILPRKYILSDITGVAYAYFAFLVMIAVVTWRKYNIKRKKEPFGETNIKKFHGSHFYSKQMLLNDLLYICCKKVCLFWIYIHFLHLYLVVKAIFNWSNQKKLANSRFTSVIFFFDKTNISSKQDMNGTATDEKILIRLMFCVTEPSPDVQDLTQSPPLRQFPNIQIWWNWDEPRNHLLSSFSSQIPRGANQNPV